MSRAFNAVMAEVWAITPEYLQVIAALSARMPDHPSVAAMREQKGWQPGANLTNEVRQKVNAGFDTFFVSAAAQRLPGGSGKASLSGNVAMIPVIGPIFPRANMMTDMSGATSLTDLQRDLSAALGNDNVNAILLCIDSPGGAVSGVAAAADAIAGVRGKKPIASHVSGTGASAAYWLLSATEHVSLDRTAMVGSIGVVAAMPKQVAPDKNGDMLVEIVSSGAPNKRPDPTTEDGYANIRSRLDDIESHFIEDVARGRGVSTDTVRTSFGQGGLMIGSAAVKAKMADQVASLEQAAARMERIGRAHQNRMGAGRS
jgi:ClpP class serine protease